jgi:hypothetical protein
VHAGVGLDYESDHLEPFFCFHGRGPRRVINAFTPDSINLERGGQRDTITALSIQPKADVNTQRMNAIIQNERLQNLH